MVPRLLAAEVAFLLIAATTSVYADDLDVVLTKAMEGTKTPALAAVEIRDGKIAHEGVRGVRRNDGPDPALVADAWLIGSNGKPMTATLIAKLVDRGVLSWDAPLAKMLPDLQDTIRPEYRSLTLTQLLSHRAGLPENVSDLDFFKTFYGDARPLPEQRNAYITRALKDAPAAAPGSKVSYSNTGFLIAAVIAERATGSSYEDLMRREVFQPLGMNSVGFGTTPVGQPIGHNDGKPIAKPEDSNPLMFAPAGNIHLSMRDWARFCADQMAGTRGQGKLLTPASYQLMQTAQPGGTSGLGWGVQVAIGGQKGPVLVHAGSDGNWYALVALFPESGRGLLVAANAGEDMGGDKAAKAALQALLAR